MRQADGALYAAGGFMLLLGAVFVTVASMSFVGLTNGDQEVDGAGIAAIVTLPIVLIFGFAVMAMGVHALLYRFAIFIDAHEVRCLQRGIRGTKVWRDPLPAYAGVLAEEEHHTGRESEMSYTLYSIVLKHESDDDRDVELYASRHPDGHREEAEAFAKLLGLPVLVESVDGWLRVRDDEDLDKSVEELVEEGKLDAHFDPGAAPQSGYLRTVPASGAYVFEASHNGGLFGGLMSVGIGAGLLHWFFGPGVGGGATALLLPAAGGLLVALGVFAVLYALFGRERLSVGTDEVLATTTVLGMTLRRRKIAASDVDEVEIAQDRFGRRCVTIAGDASAVRYGGNLRSAELRYIRSCVISTVHGGPPAGDGDDAADGAAPAAARQSADPAGVP